MIDFNNMKEYNKLNIYAAILFIVLVFSILIWLYYYPYESPYKPEKTLSINQIDTLMADILKIKEAKTDSNIIQLDNKVNIKDFDFYLTRVKDDKYKLDSYFQNKAEMIDYLLYFEYTDGFLWRFCESFCLMIKRDINGNPIIAKLIFTDDCNYPQNIYKSREKFWKLINGAF